MRIGYPSGEQYSRWIRIIFYGCYALLYVCMMYVGTYIIYILVSYISSTHSSYIHTYKHTYIHAYIRMYIHTYMHMWIYSNRSLSFPFRMVVQGSMDSSPVPSASSPDGRSYIHTYIHACMWSRLCSVDDHLSCCGRIHPSGPRRAAGPQEEEKGPPDPQIHAIVAGYDPR